MKKIRNGWFGFLYKHQKFSLSVSRSRLPQLGASTPSPASPPVGPSVQLEQLGRSTLLLLIPHHQPCFHSHYRKALLWLWPRGVWTGSGRKPAHPWSSCLLILSASPPPSHPPRRGGVSTLSPCCCSPLFSASPSKASWRFGFS